MEKVKYIEDSAFSEAETLRGLVKEARELHGPVTEQQKRESLIKSVYAGLALENCNVSIEKVRTVLSPSC